MIISFKQIYIDALKHYYLVGGMPEAVQSFAEDKDFNEIREIQKRILAAYEQVFLNMHQMRLFQKSVCCGTAFLFNLQKNKKFIYGLVREGACAKEYETAIMCLSDCDLVHKISRVNSGKIFLGSFCSYINDRKEERLINLPLFAINQFVV